MRKINKSKEILYGEGTMPNDLNSFLSELDTKKGLDILDMISSVHVEFEQKQFIVNNNLNSRYCSLPNCNSSLDLANAFRKVDEAYSNMATV